MRQIRVSVEAAKDLYFRRFTFAGALHGSLFSDLFAILGYARLPAKLTWPDPRPAGPGFSRVSFPSVRGPLAESLILMPSFWNQVYREGVQGERCSDLSKHS